MSLLILKTVFRHSASCEPERKIIAVRPEFIGLIEEAPLMGAGCCAVYVDGKESPYVVENTVEGLVGEIQGCAPGG